MKHRRPSKVKRSIYWFGFRPRLGSIFHSPNLAMYYAFNTFARDFQQRVDEGLAEVKVALGLIEKEH